MRRDGYPAAKDTGARSDSLEFDSILNRKPPWTAAKHVFKTYMCLICGFIYDEAAGLAGRGHRAGTRWEDVPIELDLPGMRRAQGRF